MSKSYKIAHDIGKKWRSKDVRYRENVDFSALLLSERVLSGLEKAGFKKPSPIQVEAIPAGKFGKDIMVQAKSGTGKTLVFVVVALETLNLKLFRPQILVIVPTREIATQVCSVVKAVSSKFKQLTCNSFIGGLPLADDQAKAIMTQIAVGTPGRLKQLIQMKSLPANSIRLVILDEADELLSGACFQKDLEDIFNALPDHKQVIATSATFSAKVKRMMSNFMCHPVLVNLNSQLALLGMVHYAEVVESCPMPVIQYKIKLAALEKILKSVKFAQCLLFVNGLQRVEILYRDVKKMGFSAAYMSSAKEQLDRLKAIDKLKRFKCKVLVSSNVTARGIDAENVDLVINFDLAYSSETYMHRVGRAGRYGTIGAAISIIDDKEVLHFGSIQRDGKFRALNLPDPIPKDLISNIPELNLESSENDETNVSDYDSGSERYIDAENNELKYASETNDIGNINDDDCSSEKNAHVENNQLKDIHEMNVDSGDNASGNVSSEPVTLSATVGIDNPNDATKPDVECQIKVEKTDKDDMANSKNKNTKTAHLKEHTDENVESENTHNHNIKLAKAKNNLLNDLDQNELIRCQASDESCPCDIHKDFNGVCEKDGIKISIEKVGELVKELSSATNIENNDFEADHGKLKEVHIDNVSKIKDIVENENYYVHLEQENITNTSKLNNMIKTFINAYESNKGMKLTTLLDEGSQQNENSGKKFVTTDMINDLKLQNQEFLYKTFKNFQVREDSAFNKNETEDGKEENNEGNTEVTTIHSELEENSECKDVFIEKPDCESTPLRKDKTEQGIRKIATAEACNPVVQNTVKPFRELPHESDFDDLESVEEVSDSPSTPSRVSSVSDDSESLSSSSDSEDDSDSNTSCDSSETTTSSDDSDSSSVSSDTLSSTAATSVDSGIYHHNYSRTGRQNPSLVSESASDHIRKEFDPMYYSRYSRGCKCARCPAPLHYNTPLRSSTRSPQMMRGINRKHNCIHQDRVNGRNDSSCIERRVTEPFLRCLYEVDYNPQNTRENGCSSNHFAPQHYNQQTHSRCCLSKDPRNRRCTALRGGYHQTCKHQTPQTNHQPLSRYMPTGHRCHPNMPGYHCENGPLCEMWYNTFCSQCLYIQNVIN